MLSFLHKPSSGADQTSLSDAYRQRLQEIAASTPSASTSPEVTPAAESAPPPVPTAAAAEENRPAPAAATTRVAAPARPVAGLDEVSVKIAQSLTECWSGALMGLDRQVSLDRDQLQVALSNLDSLAGNVQSLASCLDPLSERTDLLGRNCHDLDARLAGAEQRLASSQQGIERVEAEVGQVRELCRGMQEHLRIQGETIAALEKAVRSQAGLIETHMKTALSQIGERFESFTLALDGHADAIGKLDTASAKIDAAAHSLEERLNRQAQAIQSVHGATQAQAERWGQFREAAVGFASLLQSPGKNPPASQDL